MNEIDALAIATLVAVFIGPIFAVLISGFIETQKETRARKMEIFRTLMRTRMTPIHYEHVGALNLVEIEFANSQRVIQAWQNYLKNLSERMPQGLSAFEQSEFDKKRLGLRTKLMSEISKDLKFKVEQLDIFEGNYLPQGWNDDDFENRIARRAMIEVLNGQKALVVRPQMPMNPSNPYPPSPIDK